MEAARAVRTEDFYLFISVLTCKYKKYLSLLLFKIKLFKTICIDGLAGAVDRFQVIKNKLLIGQTNVIYRETCSIKFTKNWLV